MNTNLSTVFRRLLIWFTVVTKILKLYPITFFTIQTIHKKRMTLLNTFICIIPNVFYFNNDQLTEILLYGKEDLDINYTSILDTTINYLIESKIVDSLIRSFFILSRDVMALKLILHLKFMFLFFLVLFLLFLSFYYF